MTESCTTERSTFTSKLRQPGFLWLSLPKLITVLLQVTHIYLFLTFPSYVDSLMSRSTHATQWKLNLMSSDHLLQQLHIPDMGQWFNLTANRSIKTQIRQAVAYLPDDSNHKYTEQLRYHRHFMHPIFT